MKILLDINDNKAAFLMEVLKNFSFVKKATPITHAKASLMQEIKEAIEELTLVREGKLEARNAEDLIDEL
jgi:folate-binding Fe-S cluster repair protein YgfZ